MAVLAVHQSSKEIHVEHSTKTTCKPAWTKHHRTRSRLQRQYLTPDIRQALISTNQLWISVADVGFVTLRQFHALAELIRTKQDKQTHCDTYLVLRSSKKMSPSSLSLSGWYSDTALPLPFSSTRLVGLKRRQFSKVHRNITILEVRTSLHHCRLRIRITTHHRHYHS